MCLTAAKRFFVLKSSRTHRSDSLIHTFTKQSNPSMELDLLPCTDKNLGGEEKLRVDERSVCEKSDDDAAVRLATTMGEQMRAVVNADDAEGRDARAATRAFAAGMAELDALLAADSDADGDDGDDDEDFNVLPASVGDGERRRDDVRWEGKESWKNLRQFSGRQA